MRGWPPKSMMLAGSSTSRTTTILQKHGILPAIWTVVHRRDSVCAFRCVCQGRHSNHAQTARFNIPTVLHRRAGPDRQSSGYRGPSRITNPAAIGFSSARWVCALCSVCFLWRSLLLSRVVCAPVFLSVVLRCSLWVDTFVDPRRSSIEEQELHLDQCVGATLSTQHSLGSYLPTMCSWCRQPRGLGPPAGEGGAC